MERLENSSLPQEHEDQLQLGVRIITSAFQNKVHALQHEIGGLRMTCDEQRVNVSTAQKKNGALEAEHVEIQHRSQQLAEENKELFKTVQTLRKQIGRLDALKAAMLSSIQDDQTQEAEAGDSYSRALQTDEYLRNSTPLTAGALGYATASPHGARALAPPPAMQPYQPPHQPQPPSPAASAAVTNPVDSYQGSAAGGGAPGVDGKQFFRQARSRLSYESFNLFLASIKRLNNQQQSREETLEEARGIFGPELQDLYVDFENLLHRQGI